MGLLGRQVASEYCDVVNKTTDPAELHKIALKSGVITKVMIAQNEHTSIDTLKYLAQKDPDRKFLWKVLAKNPKLSGKHLAWIYTQVTRKPLKNTLFPFLSNDYRSVHENTLQAIAVHPNTPAPILNKLAKDKSLYVRFAVAENPEASINLKIAVLNDILDTKGKGDNTLFIQALDHKDLHPKIRNVIIAQIITETKKSETPDYKMLAKLESFENLEHEVVSYLSSVRSTVNK